MAEINTQCKNCASKSIKENKDKLKWIHCEKKDGFPDNFENDCEMFVVKVVN